MRGPGPAWRAKHCRPIGQAVDRMPSRRGLFRRRFQPPALFEPRALARAGIARDDGGSRTAHFAAVILADERTFP